MSKDTFGSVIRQAREKMGLTQKQLADKIINIWYGKPMRVDDLRNIEYDKYDHFDYARSFNIIKNLAKELNLNEDYLYYLIGRFPLNERYKELTQEKFERAMFAFRKELF